MREKEGEGGRKERGDGRQGTGGCKGRTGGERKVEGSGGDDGAKGKGPPQAPQHPKALSLGFRLRRLGSLVLEPLGPLGPRAALGLMGPFHTQRL